MPHSERREAPTRGGPEACPVSLTRLEGPLALLYVQRETIWQAPIARTATANLRLRGTATARRRVDSTVFRALTDPPGGTKVAI